MIRRDDYIHRKFNDELYDEYEELPCKNVNVCFIIPDFGSGGAQRVMGNLANRFASAGHQVSILCFHSEREGTPPFYQLDERIRMLYLPETFKRNRKRIFKNAKMARKIFNEIQADLVIAFLLPVSMYAFFATRFSKIKFIVSERNDPKETIKYKYWKPIRNYVFRHAYGCVFQTEDAQKYYGRAVLHKSAVISNPMILYNDCKDIVLSCNRSNRIVCIGRYDPQKNHPLLIRAFSRFVKKYPEYTLEIYGRDFHGYQQTLENLIAELNLTGKVKLMGAHSDLHNLIYDAKMSVLASNYEGMPNALLETVALGIPSIATDCPIGGSAKIIGNDENGILIKMNDEDQLLEKMIWLVENPDKADEISANGRRGKDKYSIEKIYAEWKALIKKTTGLNLR